MRRRLTRLGLMEYVAIAAFLAAMVVVVWVAVDSSGNDTGRVAAPRTTPPSVQVAAPDFADQPPPIDAFRRVAATARNILVIGDSTGAGSGAWVDLVARDMGDLDTVTLHQWDETADRFARPPTTYGEFGRRIDIWNLSYHGIEPDYPDHLDALPTPPEVVLLDIGHDRSPAAAEEAATVTVEAVAQRWGDVPTAVVLQNPSVGAEKSRQRAAVKRLKKFAAEYGDPVIRVNSAFEDARSGRTLVDSDSRPTDAGARLWADIVDHALGVPPR